MSSKSVIEFLRSVAARPELLEHLKARRKDEVITFAEQFGLLFTESEFNSLIWDLEVYLAQKREEKFNPRFPLWSMMWGKYYIEYLVIDLLPCFTETDFDTVMTTGKKRG